MSSLKPDPKICAFLEAEGISKAIEASLLSAQEVDQLMQSATATRYIITDYINNNPSWLKPEECHQQWHLEIRPRMVNRSWDGWYDAVEWRTGEDEMIIVFFHGYAPI